MINYYMLVLFHTIKAAVLLIKYKTTGFDPIQNEHYPDYYLKLRAII